MSDTETTIGPHVLVGVDGSDDGLRATEYAARVAIRRNVELLIVHAVDDAVLAGAWGVVYDPSVLQEAGQETLTSAIEAAQAVGLDAEHIHGDVLVGSPSGVLTRLSDNAVVVVVGRRAVSGLERIFVGSTSVGVAASAGCPVIMISAASNPQRTGGHKLIGAGVDPRRGVPALTWAFEEARARGAAVRVIFVVPQQPTRWWGSQQPPTAEQQAAMIADATKHLDQEVATVRAANPDVDVQLDVRYGDPLEVLVEQSDDLDLLVLGNKGGAIPGMTLGGVVRGAMAHARCPVAIVRSS